MPNGVHDGRPSCMLQHVTCIVLPQVNATEQQLIWDPMGPQQQQQESPGARRSSLSADIRSQTTGATLGALASSLGGPQPAASGGAR